MTLNYWPELILETANFLALSTLMKGYSFYGLMRIADIELLPPKAISNALMPQMPIH